MMKLNRKKNYNRKFADKITDHAEDEQVEDALTEEEFSKYYIDWP